MLYSLLYKPSVFYVPALFSFPHGCCLQCSLYIGPFWLSVFSKWFFFSERLSHPPPAASVNYSVDTVKIQSTLPGWETVFFFFTRKLPLFWFVCGLVLVCFHRVSTTSRPPYINLYVGQEEGRKEAFECVCADMLLLTQLTLENGQ